MDTTGFYRISLSGGCLRTTHSLWNDVGWLRVLNSSDIEILRSKFQFINNTASNFGDFIDVDLPAGEQLSINQQRGSVVTVTLAIECIESKMGTRSGDPS